MAFSCSSLHTSGCSLLPSFSQPDIEIPKLTTLTEFPGPDNSEGPWFCPQPTPDMLGSFCLTLGQWERQRSELTSWRGKWGRCGTPFMYRICNKSASVQHYSSWEELLATGFPLQGSKQRCPPPSHTHSPVKGKASSLSFLRVDSFYPITSSHNTHPLSPGRNPSMY